MLVVIARSDSDAAIPGGKRDCFANARNDGVFVGATRTVALFLRPGASGLWLDNCLLSR